MQAKAKAGDETVPALESAAGVDAHAKVVCRHAHGYEHSASYALGETHSPAVQHAVLDAVIRLTGHSVI